MTLRTMTVFLWAFLIATAAMAGEDHKTQIKIAVENDGADHQFIEINSDDPDMDLQNLAVGESKTLSDTDGKDVIVTRTENGMEFNVGGETIEIDHMPGEMHGMHEVEIDFDGHDADGFKQHKNVRVIKSDGAEGVTIISSSEIDAETRAKVEAVFEEAGQEGDVMFLDGSELQDGAQAHGDHEVRIIKKEFNETN